MFGGGFFGKPIPLKGGAPGSAAPMGQGGQPGAGQIGVVPQGNAAQVYRPAAPPPTAPPTSFQQQPLIPPTRVPMGDKKDCPICRG
jgi:hypothetical protein